VNLAWHPALSIGHQPGNRILYAKRQKAKSKKCKRAISIMHYALGTRHSTLSTGHQAGNRILYAKRQNAKCKMQKGNKHYTLGTRHLARGTQHSALGIRQETGFFMQKDKKQKAKGQLL